MTVRFQSPRQAIEVYFSARSHGPRAARPRWDGMPRTGHYSAADDEAWVAVGSILYGPAPEGCGIERDSSEERSLRRWAAGLHERTPGIEAIEKRMRRRLRAAGLMARATRWVRKQEIDGAGRPYTRHVEEVLPDDHVGSEVDFP